MREATVALMAQIVELRGTGLSNKEIAARLGKRADYVSELALIAGCKKLPRGNKPIVPVSAMPAIIDAFKSGRTLASLGEEYGVTRERIRQLLDRAGVTGCDGGNFVQRFLSVDDIRAKNRRQQAEKDKRCLDRYGCSYEQLRPIKAEQRTAKSYETSPFGAFRRQRQNARNRGIGWEMTLWQWWSVWQESGLWHQRGPGSGYCMARYGDSGPYSVENVYITTISQNIRDSFLVKPAALRRAKKQQVSA